MSVNKDFSTRYSDEELMEFKALIEKKLAKATQDLKWMEESMQDTAEAIDSKGSSMDETNSQNDLEMLQTMILRQRKHILDIQNALIRVHNKSYGICIITGELIDKRRLIAVPTTTKSIQGKQEQVKSLEEQSKPSIPAVPKKKTKPTIITKVVSPPPASKKVVDPIEDDDFIENIDDDDDEDFDRDEFIDTMSEDFDFDDSLND